MKFFGIDPSLNHTGIATVSLDSDGRYDGYSCTTLATPKGLMGAARLSWMERKVANVLAYGGKGCWTGGAIEGFAMGARGRAITEIYSLGGIIRMLLYRKQYCRVQDVPPTTLKKFMTKTGKANKFEMILAVNKYFGLEISDDNQADALALALFAAAVDNHAKMGLTQLQVECLSKAQIVK